MRGLVLAEKPSLMRAIESAYKSGGTFPFTLDFAAFHGHLMSWPCREITATNGVVHGTKNTYRWCGPIPVFAG